MKTRRTIQVLAVLTGLVLAIPVFRFCSALWREVTAAPWHPDTTELSYTQSGTGPTPVLFLHGLAGSKSYFADRYTPVPSGFRFYAVDLLGFGNSPKPDGSYDLPMHAKAVALFYKRVIRPESEQPVVIVAHSLGALVAMELARSGDIPVAQMFLIGTPLYPSVESAKEYIGRSGMMYEAMVTDNKLMALSCFFRDSYRLGFLAPLFDLPRDVYLDATRHSWTSLNGSLQNSVLGFNMDHYRELNGAKITFIHGEKDDIAPVQTVREFARQAGADMKILPADGHQVFLKAPKEILSLILERADN